MNEHDAIARIKRLSHSINCADEIAEVIERLINERDMSRAAKGYEKYGKEGMQALAKAGREGKSLDPVRNKYNKYDEGAYQGGPDKSQIPAVNRPGNKVTLQDLEKERTQSPTSPEGLTRTQQRLSQQHPLKEKMSPSKQKSFAALAPPKDKITFADKIAGAKKEVDERLGDVAAEAIKGALSPKLLFSYFFFIVMSQDFKKLDVSQPPIGIPSFNFSK